MNDHSCSERWRCYWQGRITEDSDGAENGVTDEAREDKHRARHVFRPDGAVA